MPRKVCVVVTARPSYSRIRSLLAAVRDHPQLELQLVVAASALLQSETRKPCMVTRLLTSSPGTPRGPGSGLEVSYCDTFPQQTIRPCVAMLKSAVWRIVPPVLSKYTSILFGHAAASSFLKSGDL